MQSLDRLIMNELATMDSFDEDDNLPRIVDMKFVNTGKIHPDNCCITCQAYSRKFHKPMLLGVGVNGGAINRMEIQFTLSGHRSGFWYDVLRTRRNSLWERRSGVWRCVETQPMGTWDDHNNEDECLTPINKRIFVIDHPGFIDLQLPAPNGFTFVGITGNSTHKDSTDVVYRLSFAEWVNAKSRSEGIPWTRLELPPLPDGTSRRFIFWHSITWLTRNARNQWALDRTRSEIALGSLSAAVINSAPT